jgi:glycosyltransferase involved in cell wall biosynthesis
MGARPVKVLFCESNVDGTIGGSHYCLLYLVERLDRARFEPVVLFYQDHVLVPRFRSVAETIVAPEREAVQWKAGNRTGIAPAVLARRGVNVLQMARQIARHRRFLTEQGIGLVHLNNSVRRHHDWMIAARLAGVPCLTHERGINARYDWSDRALGRRLAAIVPVSNWIRDHMVQRGMRGDNIRVLYDGLDPSSVQPRTALAELREQWRIAPDQTVVGMVGNIREWKGQETVVRAIIDVVRTRRDVVCFFVGAATAGDKPYEEKLKRLVADAGIEANVRWTGYQRDPASFLQLMSVVIHGSLRPEPFGMVVLEAMAQRKPVIGSGAGGVIEIVVEGETGYTFPPGDWAALSARLIDLLADPTRAVAMGEQGFARLQSAFTTTRYMADIHRLYEGILAGRGIPSDFGHSVPDGGRRMSAGAGGPA